jgi:hypothetical protein
MSDDCCHSKGRELERLAHHTDIRRVLVVVLVLNALMFVLEFGAGIAGPSARHRRSLAAISLDPRDRRIAGIIAAFAGTRQRSR